MAALAPKAAVFGRGPPRSSTGCTGLYIPNSEARKAHDALVGLHAPGTAIATEVLGSPETSLVRQHQPSSHRMHAQHSKARGQPIEAPDGADGT